MAISNHGRNQWNDVFRQTPGPAERFLVSDLRDARRPDAGNRRASRNKPADPDREEEADVGEDRPLQTASRLVPRRHSFGPAIHSPASCRRCSPTSKVP